MERHRKSLLDIELYLSCWRLLTSYNLYYVVFLLFSQRIISCALIGLANDANGAKLG